MISAYLGTRDLEGGFSAYSFDNFFRTRSAGRKQNKMLSLVQATGPNGHRTRSRTRTRRERVRARMDGLRPLLSFLFSFSGVELVRPYEMHERLTRGPEPRSSGRGSMPQECFFDPGKGSGVLQISQICRISKDDL